jgi:hypothetical protein
MPTEPNPEKKKKQRLSDYVKYSGMVFQMAAIIGLGVYAGIKLDEYLGLKFPVFTLILSLFSITAAVYYVIRDILKKK